MQKYSSTGNTFAIFDNMQSQYDMADDSHWKSLAQREQVDGVIFLEPPRNGTADYRMRYLNADGKEAEMCGNGARALGVFIRECNPSVAAPFRIETGSGVCEVIATEPLPSLRMPGGRDMDAIDISDLFPARSSLYLVCGVPHAVFFVTDVQDVDIMSVAPSIRHHSRFSHGVNVNFVQVLGIGRIATRVYERGVERETLSCGTGAAASALSCARLLSWGGTIHILTPGGELDVFLSSDEDADLLLAGSVKKMETIPPC